MAVLACRVVFGTTLLVFGVLLLGANNGRTAGVIACAGGIWGVLASLREGIWIDEQGSPCGVPSLPGGGPGPTSRRSAWTDLLGQHTASSYTSETVGR